MLFLAVGRAIANCISSKETVDKVAPKVAYFSANLSVRRMKQFGERLKERARQLGLSNAEVARRAGIVYRTYSYYTGGRYSEPDFETLLSLCEVLCTHPNYLLGLTDDPERSTIEVSTQDPKLSRDRLGDLEREVKRLSREIADIKAKR